MKKELPIERSRSNFMLGGGLIKEERGRSSPTGMNYPTSRRDLTQVYSRVGPNSNLQGFKTLNAQSNYSSQKNIQTNGSDRGKGSMG